jgi:hypothetical protein
MTIAKYPKINRIKHHAYTINCQTINIATKTHEHPPE